MLHPSLCCQARRGKALNDLSEVVGDVLKKTMNNKYNEQRTPKTTRHHVYMNGLGDVYN